VRPRGPGVRRAGRARAAHRPGRAPGAPLHPDRESAPLTALARGRFGLALSRRGGASGLAHAPGDLTGHLAAQAEGRACPLHALHVRHGRRRRLLAQSETTSIMLALLQGVSLQPGPPDLNCPGPPNLAARISRRAPTQQQPSRAPLARQALIRHNIALNAAAAGAAGGSAAAAVLAWGETDPAALGDPWAAPDLVVAADVVYHRNLFAPLLATLAAFGARRSPPGRPPAQDAGPARHGATGPTAWCRRRSRPPAGAGLRCRPCPARDAHQVMC